METIYTELQKQLDLEDKEDADGDPKEDLVEQMHLGIFVLVARRWKHGRFDPRGFAEGVTTKPSARQDTAKIVLDEGEEGF